MLQQLMRQQLEQQQQQQQQQDWEIDFRHVLDAAVLQLSLFAERLRNWPTSSSHKSSLSSSKDLGEAALPAVQLAMTVLQACEGRKVYVHTVLASFVRDLCSGLAAELQNGQELAASSSKAANPNGSSTSGSSSSAGCLSPAVQQLLQSEQLLRLLAAAHALYAQVLQHNAASCGESSSSSSSSRDTAAAASSSAAAENLLHSIGLSWTRCPVDVSSIDDELCKGLDKVEGTLTHAALTVRHLIQHMVSSWAGMYFQLCGSSSSSSSSSGTKSSSDILTRHHQALTSPGSNIHQQQQQQRLLLSLLQPWALLHLQLVQLLVRPESREVCFKTSNQMLNACKILDADAYAALQGSLLQPMLQLLLDNMRALQHSSTSNGAAGSSSNSSSSRNSSTRDARSNGVVVPVNDSGSSSSSSSGNAGDASASGNALAGSSSSSSGSSRECDSIHKPMCWVLMELLQGEYH
jgi:hypothetical protein